MTQRLTDLSDEELARQARAGSVASFEELVRRFQVPLLRFLSRRLPARCDAEDVLQESFVRAYQSLDQYQTSRPFRPWLFTISYRLAISHTRKRCAHGPTESIPDLPQAGEMPLQRLSREEERSQLWHVAREVLTPEQYSAVWLYYVEEMKASEIAQVLGRSWVAIKTMLHRARKRLLPHLAAFAQEGEAPARESEAPAREGEAPAWEGEAPAEPGSTNNSPSPLPLRARQTPTAPTFTAKAGEA
ncbi:MAG TPA: sigma-70 family RNA polymerase sigma factor [Tepidisphaeraceae bacterium]|nr:sigma-70 family RNA polymerase sigma factor [Tepidisphaeraceae bacterium]